MIFLSLKFLMVVEFAVKKVYLVIRFSPKILTSVISSIRVGMLLYQLTQL